jgi:hypothetical protein
MESWIKIKTYVSSKLLTTTLCSWLISNEVYSATRFWKSLLLAHEELSMYSLHIKIKRFNIYMCIC